MSREFLRKATTSRMRRRGKGGGGVREIIIERGMCYPQGLLLIASLMSLWDVLAGYWMWIQLFRLRGVGISAHQTTARFDMNIFSKPLQPPSPLEGPPSTPPHQKWPGCDGLASCVCVKLLYGSLMRRSGRRSLHCHSHCLVLEQEIKIGGFSL